MKRLNQVLPVLLAAALQVLPLLRTVTIGPAAQSSFAIILRWGLGATAAVGAFDACSGASVAFGGPTNFTATAGAYYSNNIPIVNNTKTDPGGYFVLSNAFGYTGISPGPIQNGMTTTVCMPPGLTFKGVDPNNGNNPCKPVYAAIYGTPTTPVTNFRIKLSAGHPGGSTISTNIFITILAGVSPPIITSQPISVITNAGSAVLFTVTNSGSPPFGYQWLFNTNTTLANATNATLTLLNVQPTNSGAYSVRITNSAGVTNSLFANLTVRQPLVINQQPVSVTNMAGGNAVFTVVADGSPPISYQWKLNGTTPLLNATNASLSLSNLRISQAGSYSATITDSQGSTNSIAAALVVTPPPPPLIDAPIILGASVQFTFAPVIGLTNTVLTSPSAAEGSWDIFTNVPPPTASTPITITDPIITSNRFYRVLIVP